MAKANGPMTQLSSAHFHPVCACAELRLTVCRLSSQSIAIRPIRAAAHRLCRGNCINARKLIDLNHLGGLIRNEADAIARTFTLQEIDGLLRERFGRNALS